MLKFAGLLLIIAACTAAGLTASRNLRQRIAELETLGDAILYIEEEIRYRLAPLDEIFTSLSLKPEFSRLKVFKLLSIRGFSPERAGEMVEEAGRETFLDKKDIALFSEFLGGLGGSDAEGQIARCKLYAGRVTGKLDRLRNEADKKIKLYNTFGILSGIFISLLLI